MVIKTFKFSSKDLKYFYGYEDEKGTYTKVLSLSNAREVLVNRYILLVKNKVSDTLSTPLTDDDIEVKISYTGNAVQYDIIFSKIDSLPKIDPTEFIV